jgi:hypothetical protein
MSSLNAAIENHEREQPGRSQQKSRARAVWTQTTKIASTSSLDAAKQNSEHREQPGRSQQKPRARAICTQPTRAASIASTSSVNAHQGKSSFEAYKPKKKKKVF